MRRCVLRSMERPFTLVMPGTRLVKLGHDGGVVARMSEAICGIKEVPDKRAYASAIRDP